MFFVLLIGEELFLRSTIIRLFDLCCLVAKSRSVSGADSKGEDLNKNDGFYAMRLLRGDIFKMIEQTTPQRF